MSPRYVCNIPLDIQRLTDEGHFGMILPISLKLPNGLEITMTPKQRASKVVAMIRGARQGDDDEVETEEMLWQRFIDAIKATDFAALTKFYESTMLRKAVSQTRGQSSTPPVQQQQPKL